METANDVAGLVGDTINQPPVSSPTINVESRQYVSCGPHDNQVFNADCLSSQVSPLFNVGVGFAEGIESRKLKKIRHRKKPTQKSQCFMEVDSSPKKKRKQVANDVLVEGAEADGCGKRAKVDEADGFGSIKVAEVGGVQPREEP